MVARTQSARQARRTERAQVQADRYIVRPAVTAGKGCGVCYWVVNTHSRKIYLVAFGRCDCPDFQRNGQRRDGTLTGLECKHLVRVKQEMNFTDEPLPGDETDEIDSYDLPAEETDPRAEEIRAAAARRAQAYADREFWD